MSSSVTGMTVKKKYRYRSGTVTLWEIRKYQKTTHLVLQKRPFWRLVRESGVKYKQGLCYTKDTLEEIQEIVQEWLVSLLEDVMICYLDTRRVTLKESDILLTIRMSHQNRGAKVECWTGREGVGCSW